MDAYSKLLKLYGMENIITEAVMEKLDIFQSRFGKVEEFGLWGMAKIKTDAGTLFTSEEFQ